ncbi:hypothetical protein AMECASPLE_027553 [Ameca splendens]|uniref:Uncharacterized protein n=1 Tax=Ameca splendens TaxID=208324 RepID=A0ABV0ZQ30_9TELE
MEIIFFTWIYISVWIPEGTFLCSSDLCFFSSFFLPQSKHVPLRLINLSKLPQGVSVGMHVCVSLCRPLRDLSKVYPAFQPLTTEERQRLPPQPCKDEAGREDGWMILV